MSQNYKFTYFNGRGRGESTRMLFAAGDTEYADIRIEFPDWQEQQKLAPQGALPYMVIDDTITVCQSMAINRYLARKFGMYGENDLEALYIDEIADTSVDLFQEGGKVAFVPEKDRETVKTKFEKETAPKLLGYIEHSITERAQKKETGFAVGSKLSLADIMIFNAIEMGRLQEALSNYPRITASRDKVLADKGIAKWIENRPDSEM